MIISDGDGEVKQKIQEIIVENACQEYTENVKQSLSTVNQHLDEVLVGSYADLEDLEEKIAARTNYLEKNPGFLSTLNYTAQNIKIESLREFDEIKITLKEHTRRINEKIEEIESYHQRLYELVIKNSKENLHWMKNLEELEEEMFEDCLDAEKDQLMKILEEEDSDKEPPKEDLKEPENRKSTTDQTELKITESEDLQESENIESTDQNFESEDMEEPEDPPNSPARKESPVKPEPSPTEAPPTKQEPTPDDSPSFDTVTIQKNAFSELSLDNKLRENLPGNFLLFPDVVPEVQRRKPIEDIHLRLVQQVTASDSLEGFIKLMERKPCKKVPQNEQLVDKYAGSLWFFSEKGMKRKGSKSSLSGTSKSGKKDGQKSCNILITSSTTAPASPNRDKMRKTKSNLEKTKLKYYDLLDDVNRKDLKPIKSEYPRRDNLYTETMQIKHAKSYLHWMMEENEHVWKKLLQPTVPKQQMRKKQPLKKKKKGSKASIASSEDKMKKRSVKSLSSSTSTAKNGKNKNVKSLLEYLTSPEQKYLHNRPQSLIVMPVKVSYDNFPTKEVPPLDLLPSPDIEKKVFFKYKTPRTDSGIKKPEDRLTPLRKKQQMLEQLKGLKMHNNIQSNIQKAINVIESKIIDLLSSPDGNTAAFDAMEEEITKVLKLVKENDAIKKTEAEKDDNQIEANKEGEIGDTIKKHCEEIPNQKIKKPGRSARIIEEVRRAANIEEGERLLGQVDSVIKKIDSIYHKFYDDNKSKQANIFPTMVEDKAIKIVGHENVAEKFQEAENYELRPNYHKVKKESPRKKKQEEEMKKRHEDDIRKQQEDDIKKKHEYEIRKKQELEIKKKQEVEMKKKHEDETKKKQEDEIRKKQEEEVKKIEETNLKSEMEKVEEAKVKIIRRKKSPKVKKQLEETKKELELNVEKVEEKVEAVTKHEDMTQVEEIKKTEDEIKVAEEMKLMEEIIQFEVEGMKIMEHFVQQMKPNEEKMKEAVKTNEKMEETVNEEVNLTYTFLKNLKEEMCDRHESTLKLFYAIYFSSLFFLLNFDYAAL